METENYKVLKETLERMVNRSLSWHELHHFCNDNCLNCPDYFTVDYLLNGRIKIEDEETMTFTDSEGNTAEKFYDTKTDADYIRLKFIDEEPELWKAVGLHRLTDKPIFKQVEE